MSCLPSYSQARSERLSSLQPSIWCSSKPLSQRRRWACAAVHRKSGARTNWGPFISVVFHGAFLVIPGSTKLLCYMPQCVVGSISLLVAISMLQSALWDGYKILSGKDFAVVCLTMLVSMIVDLKFGVLTGVGFSLLQYVRESAKASPVRLSTDGGVIASQALWGTRSATVVSHVRGAVRLISLQGFLFFAAAEVLLKELAKQTSDEALFFVLDFSAVTGMDGSCPLEFKVLLSSLCKQLGIVVCGCSPEVLLQLRRVGAFPSDFTRELPDGDSLQLTAQAVIHHSAWPRQQLWIISRADRALEFCELMLASKCCELGASNLQPASSELVTLSSRLKEQFGKYRLTLKRGDDLGRQYTGRTVVLFSGAFPFLFSCKITACASCERRP
ncbi:unnamed protein product [Polarella glacialis]|uniref:STAS domain-containing protein n=1 Tax=Polarella glacialis TaxID=89957 RepID=A0A813FH09_POLGL|nr:unnamed protein product [Polarella glacialis]|mmetsp:Transcript_56119/g.100894  ORF Transcript_56119/g.100894 Transcript_56119/m.100894 type:complete len:387 (-) Transcript_56119:166-1326(-)